MNNRLFMFSFLAAAFIAAPALAQTTKTVTMHNAEGKEVGTVTLTQGDEDYVLIHLEADDLPPGAHGFHIHTTGKCTPPDFKDAGGHFNPEGDEHGALHGEGIHAGDLPNIYVNEDETVKVDIISDEISITDMGDEGYLLDDDGSAFMIHAAADDYKTKDTGNAGARIACGVLSN